MVRDLLVRGRRVEYAEVGAGRPLVLLHAFPLRKAMWRHQLEAPPSGWRLIAPDLRGLGGSDRAAAEEPVGRNVGARSMNDYADDVVALAEELELDLPVVGGVSMGGYVTFAVYRKMGRRISGLILADTRADPDTDEARANRRRLQQLVLERGPQAIAGEMVPRLLGDTTRREQPEVGDAVREMIEGNSAWGIHDALEALASRPDSTPTLAEVRCPTLIVAGREDVLTPVALHETMRAAIRGASLEVIDGAGHLANLERPKDFNQLLAVFLEDLA
jgi:pimeloyl-ACP methyl ester carboxylesterase